jgi:hypothetical protein
MDLAWAIWGMKVDLDQRVLKQGQERTRAYLAELTAVLRARARALFAC